MAQINRPAASLKLTVNDQHAFGYNYLNSECLITENVKFEIKDLSSDCAKNIIVSYYV